MEPGTILTPPRRCMECGNLMVWGSLHSKVKVYERTSLGPSTREAEHYVTRSDLPPTMAYPVVVAVCSFCGHVSLYAAGVVPPATNE
jgi:hypothetical protein